MSDSNHLDRCRGCFVIVWKNKIYSGKKTLGKTILYCSKKHFEIYNADSCHIEGIKRLADANRHVFGFITRGAFQDALQAGTLIVATVDNQVVGFLRYHHRKRDRQTTLYDICVAESERSKNIGQSMIVMLIEHCRSSARMMILLKCPSHLPANSFYEKNGFRCVEKVAGKRHNLNVWQLDLIDGRHH